MIPADRLLACLDVCEASGLFSMTRIDTAHNALRLGMLVGTLRVHGSFPAIDIGFRSGTGCGATVQRIESADVAQLATFAATLARVAEVAAKCDALLREPADTASL